MRTDYPELVASLAASDSYDDRFNVSASRGDEQLTDLLVTDASFDWDSSRLIQGQANFTFADPDGLLAPKRVDDILAPGGSRIHPVFVFGAGNVRVPLGPYRIRAAKGNTQWQYRTVGGSLMWLPSGTVEVQADDETATVWLERLEPVTERAPVAKTVLVEVARLLGGAYPLIDVTGVTDRDIPSGVEYEDDRLAVVADLLEQVGAVYRQRPDGSLQILPATGLPTDWVIKPGVDGTLISFETEMDDADLANGVTSVREFDDEDGATPPPLIGRSRLTNGPLRWGGPFGKVPVFRGANLATTQAQVDADAATTLTRIAQMGDVPILVETALNPAVELYDQVTLVLPAFPDPIAVPGLVQRISWGATGGVMGKRMSLTVTVNHNILSQIGA